MTFVVIRAIRQLNQRLAKTTAGRFFAHPQTRLFISIVSWVPPGVFFCQHGYSLATITGASMQPTFNPTIQAEPLHNDVVVLERWSVSLGRFRRGDVVTLWSPTEPNTLTTKRIIALEGDLVYPVKPSTHSVVRIPEGHCWVEGDSRHRSRDSNTYGPVPLALINSRVAYVLWPWNRRGLVENSLGKEMGGRVKRSRFEGGFAALES